MSIISSLFTHTGVTDFQPFSITVGFNGGAIAGTVQCGAVMLEDDFELEGREIFRATIRSSGFDYTLADDNVAMVFIIDNDNGKYALTVSCINLP